MHSSAEVGWLAQALRLTVITDRALARPRDLEWVVEQALQGGARCVQLREKEWGMGAALPLALRLRDLTRSYGALLIVNDRLDLALAAEADGVHLGPDDLPIWAARRIAPPGFVIGYSTDEPRAAIQAVAEGADYLGCGAVWPTGTKADAGAAIGPGGVRRVVASVSIPVVAIGGITLARAPELEKCGAAGVAVVGELMSAPDPASRAAALLEAYLPATS